MTDSSAYGDVPRLGNNQPTSTGRGIVVGGHTGPDARFFHRNRNGNIILHDSFDLTDSSWGLGRIGCPEQPVIVGRTEVMLEVYRTVLKIAPYQVPALIQGETGTGKELIARALAARKGGPFETLNCSYPSGDLSFEDALFGRIPKVLTGAAAEQGRFQLADGGTLLLDNIECLSWHQQGTLLRVLQSENQVIYPVGSSKGQPVRVRVIAATNKDLLSLISEGLFREDLYERIRGVPIDLPPLRSRKADIPLLVTYFILRNRYGAKRTIKTIAHETLQRLSAYRWSRNVRQLEHEVNKALLVNEGPVLRPEEFENQRRRDASEHSEGQPIDGRPQCVRARQQQQAIITLLQKHSYRSVELARLLVCSRRTVQRLLRDLMAKGQVTATRSKDGRVIEYHPLDNPPSH